jgi:type IV pilus assembly protein PilE
MEKNRTRLKAIGFTVVELCVAIAIVALLAKIAYPSFMQYIINGRRADATTALLDLANRMEQYYAANNTFATATIAAGVTATDVLTSNASQQGYYTLSIVSSGTTTNTYTIKASRAGAQASDALCGDYQLTSAGVKTNPSASLPSSRCW